TGGSFENEQINLASTWTLKAISVIVPRLDFFAKGSWMIYGPKSYDDLWLFLVQALVFIPLLLAAAIIDFKRKQF
ncbi:MAG: hypothetical protein B7Z54_07700, partial [Sphingobacteriales bacterium 12-47-4]